jgi:uncharacterized membrane protein YhaH (DUF805 family)
MNTYLLGWRNALNISGCATRKEYWIFYSVPLLIYILGKMYPEGIIVTIAAFLLLILLLPLITISIRRFHDAGFSGWWVVLTFIPIVGLLTVVIMLMPSKMDGNKYRTKENDIGGSSETASLNDIKESE